MAAEPFCVWDVGALLGEGPVWIAAEEALYFVDIEAPALLRVGLGDGSRSVYPAPEKLGFVVPAAGGFVAGLRSGLARIGLPADPGPLRVEPILDPEPDRPGNRFNDGKCDASGRLWAGTMDDAIERPTGALYRLDPDLGVHRMDDGYVVTNGPAFAPDGRTMYHNDSIGKTVYAFDVDPGSGRIANKRAFVRLGAGEGVPDGLTVDAGGDLWLAHWGGSCVTRFDPRGRVVEKIVLPVSQVTSCAFGGADLDTLYITSARTGLSSAQLRHEPLAGGLFAVAVDARGSLPQSFAG